MDLICLAGTSTETVQDEFRAKLDDTLVIAIIGDFDLSNHEQFDQARSILNGLAQDVVTEEASGFNPSAIGDDRVGTVGYAEGLEGQQRPANPNSSNSTTGSAGLVTDFTEFTDFSDTLSERFATLDFPKDVNVATLDDDGKVAELKVMFPVLGELDIKLALKKGKGDFIKACEELLNMQYLEENGLRPKGIDGAFRLDGHVGYKGKLAKTFSMNFCCWFALSLLELRYCNLSPPPHRPYPVNGGFSTRSHPISFFSAPTVCNAREYHYSCFLHLGVSNCMAESTD